jgi:hypothetical protein
MRILRLFISAYFIVTTFSFVNPLKAQPKDSTLTVKSILTLTNNGFAIVPAFSLGKPAFLFDVSIANRRFSFEPQFRYSLHGRPWIFNFNFRYKLLDKNRTTITLGGYLPALNFVEGKMYVNGVPQEIQTVRRFVSGELIVNYRIARNVHTGIYYLQGHGFQPDGPRNISYLALRGRILKIKLFKLLYAEFNPQLYYLLVNDDSGFYVNETIQFMISNFPLSLSSTVNKSLQSSILARGFDWNISLSYLIGRKYVLSSH